MTIACCYVSPEGVILGADSTASYGGAGGMRHYNHNQKIFEIGRDGTMGIVTWGLGSLGAVSYRTLIARLADDVAARGDLPVADVMDLWIASYWAEYCSYLSSGQNGAYIAAARALSAKLPHDPTTPIDPARRSAAEEQTLRQILSGYTAGFCIGGYALPDRTPCAFFVMFDPLSSAPPTATALTMGYEFWGAPNIFQRLINGADEATKAAIVSSSHWSGTDADLNAVLAPHSLGHPAIPLRDAIDFVYMCIYSTIKAIKFSGFPRVCGGPIELAVISSDRPYRWVRHKAWDAAVAEGAAS